MRRLLNGVRRAYDAVAGTERKRAYLYRLLTAAGVVALTYGVATADEIAVWLGLANTALGGLASGNTSTKTPDAR